MIMYGKNIILIYLTDHDLQLVRVRIIAFFVRLYDYILSQFDKYLILRLLNLTNECRIQFFIKSATTMFRERVDFNIYRKHPGTIYFMIGYIKFRVNKYCKGL